MDGVVGTDLPPNPTRPPARRRRILWAAGAGIALAALAAVLLWPRGGRVGIVPGTGADASRQPPPPLAVFRQPPPSLAVVPFDAAQARAHQEAWALHLGVPVEITNSANMKLRLIPPGQGPAGSIVSPRPFFSGACEVTVGQFRQFVKETSYRTTGEATGRGGNVDKKGVKPEYIWSHPDYAPTEDHPVTLVTWSDAMAFCGWLRRKEGRTYRLPTMTEWRWAALAGSRGPYCFGQAREAVEEYAWHLGNAEGRSHPVAQKKANAWGLFDIHGNVWELTYQATEIGLGGGAGEARSGPAIPDLVYLLGGSFLDPASGVATFARNPVPTVGYFHFGFRVVLVGDLKGAP
jgi:formylglycine-generating enzyme required for sulfatase activity